MPTWTVSSTPPMRSPSSSEWPPILHLPLSTRASGLCSDYCANGCPAKAALPGLRARIEASIVMNRPRAQPSWPALAASIAVTAMVASGSTWVALAPEQAGTMRDAVVAAHIRSLMAPQPTDVVSTDRHTVKPWFSGRIHEAPRVVDLAKEGFPLVGGRLDVVGC
jgi:anti-sigma factor RsiW